MEVLRKKRFSPVNGKTAGAALTVSRRQLLALGASAGLVATTSAAAYNTTFNVAGKPYLADQTGNGDSSAAFQRALNDLAAIGGGILLIPAGNYVLSTPLTCPPCSLTIQGAGQGSSILVVQHTGNALAASCNGYSQSITIRDIGFAPVPNSGNAAGAALVLSFPPLPNGWQMCTIDSVDIGAPYPGYTGFLIGMVFTNLFRGNIRNVNYHSNVGTISGNAYAVFNGITVDSRFTDCNVDGADVGFELNNYAEGLHIVDCVVIASRGLVTGSRPYSGDGINTPFINLLGLYISGSEFNCIGPSVSANFVDTAWLTSSHFSTDAPGSAVYIQGCNTFTINGCLLTGQLNPNRLASYVGITTSAAPSERNWPCNAVAIDGCIFRNLLVGVVYQPGTTNTTTTQMRMLALSDSSLLGGPIPIGNLISQPVIDNSGNKTNSAQWLSSSSGPSQRPTKFRYSN